MGLKYRDLESLLQSKFRFVRAEHHESGHRWYELQIPDGPTVRTKVSHGTGELSKSLEGAIARQLRVRTTFFRGMMDCHNSYEDYCQKVRTTPFSPGG